MRKSSNVNEYIKSTAIIDHEIDGAQPEYNDGMRPRSVLARLHRSFSSTKLLPRRPQVRKRLSR